MRMGRGWFHRWSQTTQSFESGAGPCFRKSAYVTQDKAEFYRDRAMKERPETPLFVYRCDVCKKYHLTKQKQAPKGKEATRVS